MIGNHRLPFLLFRLARRALFLLLEGGDRGQLGGLYGQHQKEENRKFCMMAKMAVRGSIGKQPPHVLSRVFFLSYPKLLIN